MRLNVPMYNVVIVAVLQSQEDLSHVVTAHSLRVDKASRGPFDNFETKVCSGLEIRGK